MDVKNMQQMGNDSLSSRSFSERNLFRVNEMQTYQPLLLSSKL